MGIRQDVVLVVFVFLGAASLAISQSDRDILDPKLWALALAAGSAALVALLRPPGSGTPSSRPPSTPIGSGGRG